MARIPSPENLSPAPLRSFFTSLAKDRSAMGLSCGVTRGRSGGWVQNA